MFKYFIKTYIYTFINNNQLSQSFFFNNFIIINFMLNQQGQPLLPELVVDLELLIVILFLGTFGVF